MPRATMSLAETILNLIARFSKAKCNTDNPVRKIVTAMAWATPATLGSWYISASRDPAAANAIANSELPPTLIQNRLLASV